MVVLGAVWQDAREAVQAAPGLALGRVALDAATHVLVRALALVQVVVDAPAAATGVCKPTNAGWRASDD